jgi:hypothetical protein
MLAFLWHASSPPNERSRVDPCRASARLRAHPANTSIMRRSRDDGSLPMPACPSCAGSSDAARLIFSASPHYAHNVMRAFPLGSSQWWRRGLQHRRPGVRHLPSPLARRATSPAISTLTTAETSSSKPAPPGFDRGRSRHGAQLAVDQPSSDTGGSIPSRPSARVTPDR